MYRVFVLGSISDFLKSAQQVLVKIDVLICSSSRFVVRRNRSLFECEVLKSKKSNDEIDDAARICWPSRWIRAARFRR